MRVLTLNLWGEKGPLAARRVIIRDWILELKPDLIGFQEVVHSEGQSQVSDFLEEAGYTCRFGRSLAHGQSAYGNSIASRWPISYDVVHGLPSGPGRMEPRSMLIARVCSPQGDLSFACTHLSFGAGLSAVRTAQIEAVRRFLSQCSKGGDLAPVLVGDFNCSSGSPEMKNLRKGCKRRAALGFYDAWLLGGDGSDGFTHLKDNPYSREQLPADRRVDYILIARVVGGMVPLKRVIDCRVVCTAARDGVWASDHFGVFAELQY